MKRFLGFWIGLGIIGVSVAPLLLYVIFGPKDGNPVGLGLLMVFGVPVGIFISVVGAVIGIAVGRKKAT